MYRLPYTLNSLHSSLTFTMELPVANKISFVGIENFKNGANLKVKTIALLHFYSHTNKRYKDSLLETIIHRAYDLSSTTKAFNAECVKLRSIFSRLDYPMGLINSAIINSFYRNASAGIAEKKHR